jgi:hypothetical protein
MLAPGESRLTPSTGPTKREPAASYPQAAGTKNKLAPATSRALPRQIQARQASFKLAHGRRSTLRNDGATSKPLVPARRVGAGARKEFRLGPAVRSESPCRKKGLPRGRNAMVRGLSGPMFQPRRPTKPIGPPDVLNVTRGMIKSSREAVPMSDCTAIENLSRSTLEIPALEGGSPAVDPVSLVVWTAIFASAPLFWGGIIWSVSALF